ncbi:MAG: permease, partial [Chloroflexota bacterium]|nr:permease [Chloroflexota bacterium]
MEAFNMAWEVLWPLILGFALSGALQAVVSRKSMARLLGDDSPRSLTFTTLFGIASSSCSYAAVALARSLFLKGASFTAAMVFQLASTNLVIELGVILVVLMGWPFAAAEFSGGIIMVLSLAVLFRLTLTPRLVELARRHAERGLVGRMEGHAGMDMHVEGGSVLGRLLSGRGLTATSHYFVTAPLPGLGQYWRCRRRRAGRRSLRPVAQPTRPDPAPERAGSHRGSNSSSDLSSSSHQ